MSAGLLASTVTPGITAPEVSRTDPAIVPLVVCAELMTGNREIDRRIRKRATRSGFIAFSFARAGWYPARKVYRRVPRVRVSLRLIGLRFERLLAYRRRHWRERQRRRD